MIRRPTRTTRIDTLIPYTTFFRSQILGNCQSVVESLGALRNKLGDAHSGGPKRARPAARHAELAVNLAGSMATFLVATWEARKVTIEQGTALAGSAALSSQTASN